MASPMPLFPSRVPCNRRGVPQFIFAVVVAFLAVVSVPADARDVFFGLAPEVSAQAEKVVASSDARAGEGLDREVENLRKKMSVRGVLSINEIPDLIITRAGREGWPGEVERSLRAVTPVSALSVPLWVYLVKQDVVGLRFDQVVRDMGMMTKALRMYPPGFIGATAFLISFVSAAGCWFALWVAVSMYLRARPALEADILRFLRVPYADFITPALAVLLFILPMLFGVGMAMVACFWMMVAAGYLRRAEIVMVVTSLALLGSVLFGGAVLVTTERWSGENRLVSWLGVEGAIPEKWPSSDNATGDTAQRTAFMVRFAQARAEMIAGRPVEAEQILTEMTSGGLARVEVLNNRGVARAQQGRLKEALEDFESVLTGAEGDPPALWNAYQVHLRTFNIVGARAIEKDAWVRLQEYGPFGFKPALMEQGEWVASALPAEEAWDVFMRSQQGDWSGGLERSDFYNMFFRPLSARTAVVFLVLVGCLAMAWKFISLKLWINRTCRCCGGRSLIVGEREASDICNPCRSRIGDGIHGGDERERRIQGVILHRRYVYLASLVCPGQGALWAGKDVGAMFYGIALSVCLGGVSISVGAQRVGAPLLAELARAVIVGSLVATAILWVFGVMWSIFSFRNMQWTNGLSTFKR